MAEEATKNGRKFGLLFGCPLNLSGVQNDIQAMERALQEYGFECTIVCPATRSGILDAWNQSIKKLSNNDAIVIYYSGHGGMVEKKDGSEAGVSYRRLQYLLPMDFYDTTATEWKGITDIELSKLQRATTDKTKNTTVILDCCYAAKMARLPGTIKTVNPDDYKEVYNHITKMFEEGKFDDENFHYERNPDAIVAVATTEMELAYEQRFGGITRSVFTEALEAALKRPQDVNTEISWRTVLLRVRNRMKVTLPQQYPQIEGDDLKLTFSLNRASLSDTFPVSWDGDDLVLEGGHLHGVMRGDRYALFPPHTEVADFNNTIGEGLVTGVGPTLSRVVCQEELQLTQEQKTGGMKAFLRQRDLVSFPVALKISDSSSNITSAISDSNFVSVAVDGGPPPLATINQSDRQVQLLSHEGGRSTVLCQWDTTENGMNQSIITDCVNKLVSLARSRHLLSLESNFPTRDISKPIEIKLSRVRQGERETLSGETITLNETDKICFDIRNTGKETVYVSLLEVCAGSIMLLSVATPSGHELEKDQVYSYGRVDFTGELIGSSMKWPEDVPKTEHTVLETVVVIVTDQRFDVGSLQAGAGATRGSSELAELIEQISTGTKRFIEPETRAVIRFGVQRISFSLVAA
ncbi:caspase domain-containing protein [Xylaria cubensis]|nr:caspase domain-containing protein [Xylaria cubensis]